MQEARQRFGILLLFWQLLRVLLTNLFSQERKCPYRNTVHCFLQSAKSNRCKNVHEDKNSKMNSCDKRLVYIIPDQDGNGLEIIART